MQQANSSISIDFGVRDWCPILFTITKLLGINISCIREYTWKLPWLRTLLHERGIQTSCDGKAKRKAELAELAVNAPVEPRYQIRQQTFKTFITSHTRLHYTPT